MASYRYRAFAQSGTVIAGMIEAGSQAEALKLIHDRGMLAFEAGEGNSPGLGLGKAIRERFSRRLQLAGRVALTRDLAMLLKAEVTVDQTLRILSEGGAKPAIRKVVQHCAEGVAAGQTLSAALKSSRGGFRADELAMIAAGEQNGSLAEVLAQLAKLLERRLELSHRLTSALIYPALLILMAIASIFVIITVLIPNIEPLFEGNNAKLPVIVGALLALRDTLDIDWPFIVLAIAAAGTVALTALRMPGPRLAVDRLILRLPAVGGLVRRSIMSRICLTLATLIESGVPLQQSLAATINVAHNQAARAILDQVAEQVVTGGRLSESISGNRLFDEPSVRLIALGEETNRLHHMLHHIAATSEAHVVRQVERAMTLLTPVLTLVLGVMVGGIIMSVMQAILSINEIAVR